MDIIECLTFPNDNAQMQKGYYSYLTYIALTLKAVILDKFGNFSEAFTYCNRGILAVLVAVGKRSNLEVSRECA